MKTIEDLDVYKVAYSLVLKIYKSTEEFPKTELFGLRSQMTRAAVSVVSNLSEGGARITDGEKQHFYGIARGSVCELITQINISKDLSFIMEQNFTELLELAERVRMMLNKMIK
ncbi:MAG: four helix bundle protein [Alphaproteobacteria bacterium]|nr:four helix bundle protein [Alphaproteobacteria bacterium]